MRVILFTLIGLQCSCSVFADTLTLRKEILESCDKVRSWQIEYDLVSPTMKPGDKATHRNVALRYPDYLFHWVGNVPFQSRRTWKDDILQQRTIVSGSKCYWDFPMRRASKSWDCDSKSLIPGSLRSELLWDVLVWWPFTTDSNHLLSRESYTVEDVLRDDAYEFSNAPEGVGENLCHVLRCEGKGALWFDVNEPSIMRKREWYDTDVNSIWRAEPRDHQEIEPGVFCPKTITWTELRKNSVGESNEKIKEFSALIVSAKFNDSVPQGLFDFPEPLPGHVDSTDDGYRQIRPGANEYADSILDWIKTVAPPSQPKGMSWWELAFHVGLYCFAAVLSFKVGIRWWKSRNQAVCDDVTSEQKR